MGRSKRVDEFMRKFESAQPPKEMDKEEVWLIAQEIFPGCRKVKGGSHEFVVFEPRHELYQKLSLRFPSGGLPQWPFSYKGELVLVVSGGKKVTKFYLKDLFSAIRWKEIFDEFENRQG